MWQVFAVSAVAELSRVTYIRSWALLEKLPVVQLLKNYPVFYGTRRFITVFTRALHWSLSWARSIQSIPSHPISVRSIIVRTTLETIKTAFAVHLEVYWRNCQGRYMTYQKNT
jgi:hypothetical protein